MIFQDCLKSHLGPGERVEADDGYVGESPAYIKCPKSFTNDTQCLFMQQRVRSRQETVNKRFKNWGILKQVFRGDILDHGDAVHAVGVLTQLSIMGGEQLFTCGYRDPPYENEDGDEDNNEDGDDIDDDDDLSYDTSDTSL